MDEIVWVEEETRVGSPGGWDTTTCARSCVDIGADEGLKCLLSTGRTGVISGFGRTQRSFTIRISARVGSLVRHRCKQAAQSASFCRTIVVSSTKSVRHVFHMCLARFDARQFSSASMSRFVGGLYIGELLAGGNWKKSPQNTICTPPNSVSFCPLRFFSREFRRSNRAGWHIENSSTIKIPTGDQARCRFVFGAGGENVRPVMPRAECSVIPPISIAATPDVAVIRTAWDKVHLRAKSSKHCMTRLFPVPPEPLRYNFKCPSSGRIWFNKFVISCVSLFIPGRALVWQWCAYCRRAAASNTKDICCFSFSVQCVDCSPMVGKLTASFSGCFTSLVDDVKLRFWRLAFMFSNNSTCGWPSFCCPQLLIDTRLSEASDCCSSFSFLLVGILASAALICFESIVVKVLAAVGPMLRTRSLHCRRWVRNRRLSSRFFPDTKLGSLPSMTITSWSSWSRVLMISCGFSPKTGSMLLLSERQKLS